MSGVTSFNTEKSVGPVCRVGRVNLRGEDVLSDFFKRQGGGSEVANSSLFRLI